MMVLESGEARWAAVRWVALCGTCMSGDSVGECAHVRAACDDSGGGGVFMLMVAVECEVELVCLWW